MSSPPEAQLEGPKRVLELSRSLSAAGVTPQMKASIQQLMISLAIRPSFSLYLSTTDPAAIPADEWTPTSPTVKAVSLSFDAISAVIHAWSSQPYSSSDHVALRFASTFFPATLRWIRYLHPLYTSLRPDAAYIHALVDLILALHTLAESTPISGEHISALDEHTVTLWPFMLVKPEIDKRPNLAYPLCSEMLARCILGILLPAAEAEASRTDMTSIRTMVRDALRRTTTLRPGKLFETLLNHSRTIHRLDTAQSKSKEFSAMRWHLHLIAVLMRDVYPTWRPSRTVLKIIVNLGRDSPCAWTTMAICALLITIWERDHSGNSLVWSVKAGLVRVLKYGSASEHAKLKEARTIVFRYITYRTSLSGVLRALLKQGRLVPLLVGRTAFREVAGAADSGQLAQHVQETLQSRMDSLDSCISRKKCATCGADSTSSKFCCPCYNAMYCSKRCQKQHWALHKPCCLWYVYRFDIRPTDHIGSPFDMGFSLVQIINYLRSDKADDLFESLAISRARSEVHVEIALDKFPPSDTAMYLSHSGQDSETVLLLEARLFVRGKASVVSFEPRPLSSFLAVFEGESDSKLMEKMQAWI